ncbi:hypothetical protein C8F04DRAFT_1064638 [Mycena alexandri]|uniref:Uncharacterized protein n=1 Tax=Mycena alexandri TaxID=1745969 RepID=A0AAD6TGR4_9AGAR|nr:hypothetical protein C8F04DRAFT_1064638 [Mycena alexandri]
MFSLSPVVVVLAVASSTYAALSFTSPTQAISFAGGQQANITWIDDGAAPALAQFGLAKASIYAGNSISQTSLLTISESIDVTNPMFLVFTPDASIGPNSDQYFIRFESLALKDAANPAIPALAFSHTFTMSAMTGVFDAEVLSEIAGQSTAPIGGTGAAAAAAPSTAPSTPAAGASTKSAASTAKSAAPSTSGSKSAKSAAASGTSAAGHSFVAGPKLWLGIATGVFGALMGAAVL